MTMLTPPLAARGAAMAPDGRDRRREDLVRNNIALVRHLVRELRARIPQHVDSDDLTSAGLVALVASARGFDPDRGIPFARFAAARVRGALVDELRGVDWASRSVRARARKTDTVREQLTAELGRAPSIAELAGHLGVRAGDLYALTEDVQRAAVLSLQGFSNAGVADDLVAERSPGPEEVLLRRERIGYLHDAIAVLPERLRQVVTGYFLLERPMAAIAAELGISESRVSQLRSEALSLLRDGLNATLDPDLLHPSQHGGCVARRRAAYCGQVAAHGTLRSRLAVTDHLAVPMADARPAT